MGEHIRWTIFICFPELIEKHNYNSETHFVETSDGYILGIHRIIGHKYLKIKRRNKVFLLWHGLQTSSSDFVFMGSDHGLAYYLSDLGFDVWLGNSRGNRYSNKHISMNDTNNMFWKFSFHEIGTIDLPETIDYILNATGEPNLTYAGFSQGTTQVFVMASEKPDYLKKISHIHGISPVVYLNNTKSPIFKFLTTLIWKLENSKITIEPYGFLSKFELIPFAARFLCIHPPIDKICREILYMIAGFNSPQINSTMLPVILSHFPAGSSSQQLSHFGQHVLSGRFRKYDFGEEKNIAVYGQQEPTEYTIKTMKIPIALYYSDNDSILQPADVFRLTPLLSSLIELYRIPNDKFNHFDFILGIDARSLLYKKIGEIAIQYS